MNWQGPSESELEWVIVNGGRARHGDYMRRYHAEAEEVPYRECTDQDLETIERLESK